MVIAHNIAANFTKRNLGITNKSLIGISEKISSGYRINRAADDAAGLAISEEMRGQIRGLNKSLDNIEQGSDFCQVADAAMQEISNIVQRMRELSVQAANDTYVEEDRKSIQNEIDSLTGEITHITDDTEYNTIKVFQKHRKRIGYEVQAGTKLVPVSKEIIDVKTQNYGITEVLGEEHVYQGEYMDNKMQFTGNGWHHTGAAPKAPASASGTKIYTFDSNGKATEEKASYKDDVIKYLNETYGVSVPATSSTSQTLVSNNGKSKIELKYSGYYDANGNNLLSGYKIETYDKAISDPSCKLVRKESNNNLWYNANGTSGAGRTTTYGTGWLDFSGLGTDYKVENLYGQAFNTVCGHGCGDHYNIIFSGEAQRSTNADGVNYTYERKNGSHPTVTINISNCTTGADVVKSIVSAVNSNPGMTDHYNQFAYNDSEPAKLYVYDSYPGSFNGKFQPVSWTGSSSTSHLITTWVEVPVTTKKYKYEDYNLYLQVGSNSNQMVELYTPWLNTTTMGVSNLNLTSQEGAENAIASCDYALEKLNDERTTVGALSNRLMHAYDNNSNVSENLQSSESKLRDANIQEDMVSYAAYNILQQAGQSMLAQTNKANDGILMMLQSL